MDDTIISTYYLCEEFLSARGHRDDPQARISTAEVMTTALVAAALFGGNIERTRSFLDEYGYISKAISKSRFNRRLHAIDSGIWRTLFDLLAEVFKRSRPDQEYVVDSLPVAVCDNSSASSGAGSIPARSMERPSGAISPPNAAISTGSGCISSSAALASRWSSRWGPARRPTSRCSRRWI